MTHEELCDTGDVIKAESEQKEYWLRVMEKSRLYDLIEEQTASQIAFLKTTISKLKNTESLEDAKKLLSEIVVVGTYIKRKSNLMLICGEKDVVDVQELKLCINETAKNLRLYGIDCKVNFEIKGLLMSVLINGIYDFFEFVIESCLNSMKSILIFVGKENENYKVNISVQCDTNLSLLNEQIPMLVSEYDEDGIWYLSLTFDKGGETV